MTKHEFHFDEALTINEFFEDNGVARKSFMLKECQAENGSQFTALGLANGKNLEDGRTSYTFFVLSDKLEKQGEVLNKAFLKAHKNELMVIEHDDLKFGILYLPGEAESWDDL